MKDLITVVGNVATEPTSRILPDGASVTTFRLASNERRFDQVEQRWRDRGANYYTVSVFRGLGEHVLASVQRGQPVIVVGKLVVERWEKADARGTEVKILADAVGHDLRWGTTTFSRAAQPPQPQLTVVGDEPSAPPTPTKDDPVSLPF